MWHRLHRNKTKKLDDEAVKKFLIEMLMGITTLKFLIDFIVILAFLEGKIKEVMNLSGEAWG